jgi:hypothetical protein
VACENGQEFDRLVQGLTELEAALLQLQTARFTATATVAGMSSLPQTGQTVSMLKGI